VIGGENDYLMKKASNSSGNRVGSSRRPPKRGSQGKKGVRGKYYQAYRRGPTVRIRHDDSAVTEQHLTLEEGAVMLEPDVREYFPTSESVNQALRSLITRIPRSRRRR
jgi:hypothetical protein